jgi:cytochrome P450
MRLVGNGLVTSEGDFWRRQRRLAQPAFHRDRVASYGETMVAFAERMLSRWRDGETRDAHEEMMRLTQSIVVKTLFSADVSDEADRVGAALRRIVQPFASQATLKWILDNRLPTPGHFRYNRAVREIDRVVYQIISERRASGADTGDLLSMLLRAQDEDGSQMTDRQLRDEVMTLFLAGHETTALALTWAWYLLAREVEAESKLHAELSEVLGGRAPTVEDLPRLRYTEWVVKESMRLYPTAYAVGREAVRDCEVGGYRIPEGMQVFAFQWVVQRDARWYEEPGAFRPERWREEVASRLPKFAYFPFGGGPRQCIGNFFATMEAVLVLATVAQRFRLRLAPGHAVELLPAMSLRPRDGVMVKLERR